jgi:Fe-S oxidoreductase
MEQGNRLTLNQLFEAGAKDLVERCIKRGECLNACTIFPLTKFADQGPIAMIEKVTELLSGGELTEEACDMIWSCGGGCDDCCKVCPRELMPNAALFAFGRARLFAAGKEPPAETYTRLAGHRCRMANVVPTLQLRASEERWIKKIPAQPEPADLVFFPSCSGMILPHIVLELEDLFDKMGLKVASLAGGNLCGGASGVVRGDVETAERLNKEWVSAIMALQPQKAIFYCGGCEVSATGTALFPALPVHSQWVLDFLLENVDRIPFTRKVNKVVTIHDSCDVARSGYWEVGRALLRAIPGITLVEMEHGREKQLCCGGAGGITRPEITMSKRQAIMQDVGRTGADIMATTCSGCQRFLEPLDQQYPFEVRNVISLIAEAAGVQREDRFRKYNKCRNTEEVLVDAREYIEASDYSAEEMRQILPGQLKILPGQG